ncbi:MAG: HAMP domain-containing sensor histidine kinase [Elusimicrobiota bacterium]
MTTKTTPKDPPARLETPRADTRWTLRRTLRLAAVLLFLCGLGPAISYRILKRAEDGLSRAFRTDLTFLAELPPLQGWISQTDLYTAQFLATNDRTWLEYRDQTLGRINDGLGEVLRASAGAPDERRTMEELDRLFKAHISEQDEWIRRSASGRLPPTKAAVFLSKQRPLDRLVEMVLAIRKANIQDLQARNLAVRRSSITAFWIVMLTSLASVIFLVYILARYVVDPISTLANYAREWNFERPWDLQPGRATPEIQTLHVRMRQMAQRLAERYKKESELVHLKSALISVISHEFNNALSVIQGITSVLEETEGEPYDEKRKGYYEMLKANARSLALEVASILNMGRLESGRFAFRFAAVDPAEVIGESLRKLKILYERKKLKVSVATAAPDLRVRADREALILIATNLLTNAIKYTRPEGAIRITCAPDEGRPQRVRVTFEDSGIGMSPDDIKRAMSGYYRSADGMKMARGFGVGLSLTQSILTQLGSAMEISSEQGKGSAFSFALPRCDEDAPKETDAEGPCAGVEERSA